MFELMSGNRNNQQIIASTSNPVIKSKYIETIKNKMSFKVLQDIIDNYDKSKSGDTPTVEAALTYADDIYEEDIEKEVIDNMWFQWCVNRYNADNYKIKSYQVAEDLYRRTNNDYRKVLNAVSNDVHKTTNDFSFYYKVIEGVRIGLEIPTRELVLDGKKYYILDMDTVARLKVSAGIAGSDFADDIDMGKVFVGMTKNQSDAASLGFLKKDPGMFFKKIDLNVNGEDILDESWARGKALEIEGIENAYQKDEYSTIINFTFEEDANDAVNNGVCKPSDKFDNDTVIYEDKVCFLRNIPSNGVGRLVPMRKR